MAKPSAMISHHPRSCPSRSQLINRTYLNAIDVCRPWIVLAHIPPGPNTSTEDEYSRLEGHAETAPGEYSQQQQQQQQHDEQKSSTFERTTTRDSLCLILANLHPRDGLKVLCLCSSTRSLARKELWEWWALALWPERIVLPSVPRLYPDFEALVRDDNRRGAMLTVRWSDVGNNRTLCFFTGNRPSYFFACRLLAVEYDRHQHFLSVHFDVRGEGDLVQPGHARLLLLGPKTREIASPIPHRVCRLIPGRESYIAVPVPSAVGMATLAPYPPAIGLWTFESNLDVAWSRSTRGKRCTGHVTFNVKDFERRLRLAPGSPSAGGVTFNMKDFEQRLRLAPGYYSSADGAHLQLKFVYSMLPSYTAVTLAEWPTAKRLSVATALTEHTCHGPTEIGTHAAGEMSGEVNGVVGGAKERFNFVPDGVKSRPEWWA